MRDKRRAFSDRVATERGRPSARYPDRTRLTATRSLHASAAVPDRWVSLVVEVEDPHRVSADHAVALVGGDVAHRVLDDLARVRPVVAVVRVVARPHDRVDPDTLTQLDARTVGDERRAVVAPPVEGRWLADRELTPGAVAPELVVEHLDEVRQPTDADLDPRDVQLGKPVEHPGEDHLRDVSCRHR